jgi:stage III sporulation protein AA
MQEIFNFFPVKISNKINEQINGQVDNYINRLEEIRIRNSKPIILKYSNKEIIMQESANSNEILEIIQKVCNNSIYSYQNQICNGYITIKGGHRVGITGNCTIDDNKVININYISSLNFRIARQILGCSNKILKYILNLENKSIYNTLIVSPPGAGKTTLLRDLIRNVSTGIEEIGFEGLNCRSSR